MLRRSGSPWVLASTAILVFAAGPSFAQSNYELPPVPTSQHAGHGALPVVDALQPGFPAQVVLSSQSDSDLFAYGQITSAVGAELVSVKLGWAYALPSGLEFHESDTITPPGGLGSHTSFQLGGQHIAPRADAKGVLLFVEQTTGTDGTVTNADHAALTAFYNSCCGEGAHKPIAAADEPKTNYSRWTTAITAVQRLQPSVNAQGLGIVPVPQPDMPFEFVSLQQTPEDWFQGAQIHNRSPYGFSSYRIGWAYVMPTGIEYHHSDVIQLDHNIQPDAMVQAPDLHIAPQKDAKELLVFVEDATQGDGTAWHATPKQVEADYHLYASRDAAGHYTLSPANRAQLDEAMAAPVSMTLPIQFDIVSFRPAQERGSSHLDMPAQGDYIAYHGAPINALLQFAYEHKGYFHISGEPAWVTSDPYEFQAKVAPEDVAAWRKLTLTERRAMVRTLLAQQLKLQVRQDTEEHPVYNLVVAKGGPKLTPYQPGDTIKMPWGQTRSGRVLIWVDPFHLVCQDETMADLVNSLSGENRSGRVVLDKTGLTGTYNFAVPIPYQPLPQQLQQMSDDAGVPTVFDGLKQLGLQLQPGKGRIDGIIIDHIEKPPTN